MAGLLTSASVLMCPHGGTVTASTSGPRPTAGGTPILLATDPCTVAGCSFTLPPSTPSPCVLVQWTVTNLDTTANEVPTLGEGSVGLCIGALGAPQGSVIVSTTQSQVTGS